MGANAIAFGTLGIIAATLLLTQRFGRPVQREETGLAIVGAVGLWMALMPIVAHACERGQPWRVVGIACLCAAWLAVRVRRIWAPPLALLFLCLGAAMGASFGELVHGRGYTGNPAYARLRPEMYARSALERTQSRLLNMDPDAEFPAGWADDIPALHGAFSVSDVLFRLVRVRWLWHTAFTGLYGEERGPRRGLWYPGGPADFGAEHLEWRQRPESGAAHADGAPSLSLERQATMAKPPFGGSAGRDGGRTAAPPSAVAHQDRKPGR